ncbi:MAG: peptide chain release factor N(5)-glutamine methyltransferase [Gemmatimonadetes bacterium]|nr:peptide chain release factor N(5)-glutamine methyltransferase [Gemmatimonadota bacterium]
MHLVRWAAGYLEEKGVESPRLDAELLLAEVLHMSRLDLYLHFDRPVGPDELASFKRPLLDRATRMPLQYILGRTSFRELELMTDPRVLIPRPETEELVGAVLDWAKGAGLSGARALDIGTGSGAIAISLALEGPFEGVVATDPSEDALDVARENARRAGVGDRIDFRRGSFYEPILGPEGVAGAASDRGERFDVIVSNPPYVAEEEFDGLEPEIRQWEPRGALVAPDAGLGILRELVDGAGAVLEPGGLLALEVGLGQATWVADRVRSTRRPGAAEAFIEPRVLRDLAGRECMVLAERRKD